MDLVLPELHLASPCTFVCLLRCQVEGALLYKAAGRWATRSVRAPPKEQRRVQACLQDCRICEFIAFLDPIEYWDEVDSGEFPFLYKHARRLLSIPTSSAASERAWSALANIHTKRRNCLAAWKVDTLALFTSTPPSWMPKIRSTTAPKPSMMSNRALMSDSGSETGDPEVMLLPEDDGAVVDTDE